MAEDRRVRDFVNLVAEKAQKIFKTRDGNFRVFVKSQKKNEYVIGASLNYEGKKYNPSVALEFKRDKLGAYFVRIVGTLFGDEYFKLSILQPDADEDRIDTQARIFAKKVVLATEEEFGKIVISKSAE